MRLFYRKSMSRRIFLSILAIIGFILSVLFSVSMHLLQESYEREERTSVLEKLTKCSRITDLSLEYMGQDSRMLSTNPSLISAVVAPDHNRADRSISVLNLLEDVARTNELVSQAVLYVDFDHSIYVSDSLETDLAENETLSRVVAPYLLTGPSVDRSILYMADGAAYMMQDIPVNGRKRLGTVILKVDTDHLYRQIQDVEDGSYIIAINKEGDVFLADRDMPSPVLSEIRTENQKDTKKTTAYTSLRSGLTFYNWKSDATSFAGTVVRYSPLLLIAVFLALVGAVYSVLASRAAYLPIRKLVEAVSAQSAPLPEEKRENEIDYLKELFDRTMADRESLIATTAMLIPKIEQGLLTDLTEDAASAERVQASLEDINSRFALEGLFGVMALEISPAEAAVTGLTVEAESAVQDRSVAAGVQDRKAAAGQAVEAASGNDSGQSSETQKQAELTRLEQEVREWSTDVCQMRLLPMEGRPCAVILRMDASTDRDLLREKMKELLLRLKQELGKGFTARAGIGGLCSAPGQIAGAYKEACKVMTASMNRLQIPDAGTVGLEQIREHLSCCIVMVLGRRPVHAREEVDRFCRIFGTEALAGEERTRAAALYIGEIARYYALLNLEGVILPESLSSREEGAAVKQLTGYGREFVDALDAYCHKKSNRQVIFAKQYIMDHYQDGMLSLGEVAEKVGIKPTYLSTLFASVSGIRFSDFLKAYRVEMAGEYLKNSELPIKEIGMRCGFNSVQSFNRVFKQVTGQAPGEYRVGRGNTGKI